MRISATFYKGEGRHPKRRRIERDPRRPHSEGDPTMILVILIVLLALFSLISYLLGTDEPRQNVDPGDDVRFLMRFGSH
jgi:hypothetical protein